MKKVFFPNLDGFRFLAFLSVFLYHSFHTDYDYIKDSPVYKFINFLFAQGELGVNFFFVLSGFLISYLLFVEKLEIGRIRIFDFYLRRVLRIWPLYFVVLLIGFYFFPIAKSFFGEIPHENARIGYYLLFLSNIDIVLQRAVPDSSILSVLWSIAVEEQFYLVWPLIIFLVHPRFLPILFCAIIIVSLAFRANIYNNQITLYFHTFSVVIDMAIGGLFAWLCYRYKGFLILITNIPKQVIILLYVITLTFILFRAHIFTNPFLIVTDRLIFSFLFGLIIIEQNFAQHSLFKMANFKRISWLGKYTYGLYILQFIGILITTTLSRIIGTNKTVFNVLIGETLVAFFITFFMSYISYHYFETYFLKLKNKFSVIKKQ